MSTNLLLSKLQNAVTLYSEILLCIIAATLLGWFIGTMMQKSRHQKILKSTVRDWERRYYRLEESAATKQKLLEDQLSTMNEDLEKHMANNQVLKESLRKNEHNTQQARAETIALNRQHTETHDRLQRIVQQKDKEITELGDRVNKLATLNREANSGQAVLQTAAKDQIPEYYDTDVESAATVALLQGDLQGDSKADSQDEDSLDATIQMTLEAGVRAGKGKSVDSGTAGSDSSIDSASFDDTADLSGVGIEESTVLIGRDILGQR